MAVFEFTGKPGELIGRAVSGEESDVGFNPEIVMIHDSN